MCSILLGFGSGWLSILAIVIMGLGFGAIYPTIMAVMTRSFHEAPGVAGSVVTAMISVGGSLLPWLQGLTLESLGMRAGTFFMGILVLLLIGSFVVSQRIRKMN
jgi:fucose permease